MAYVKDKVIEGIQAYRSARDKEKGVRLDMVLSYGQDPRFIKWMDTL